MTVLIVLAVRYQFTPQCPESVCYKCTCHGFILVPHMQVIQDVSGDKHLVAVLLPVSWVPRAIVMPVIKTSRLHALQTTHGCTLSFLLHSSKCI